MNIHERLSAALGNRAARITTVERARARLRDESDAIERIVKRYPGLELDARLDLIDGIRSELDSLEGLRRKGEI